MDISMNGRKVKVFRRYDDHGNPHDISVGRKTFEGVETTDIIFTGTYHGDHDQFWIVETRGGVERWHNVKAVDFFELEPEVTP